MKSSTAAPSLTLRNGVTIGDPLRTALEFVALDSSYVKYDRAPVARDDVLTLEDVRTANWMIARMSTAVIEGIYARASAINAALGKIPSDATLVAADHEVPWAGLEALMRAIHGAPEVGLPRATKVLHKKRPALIPILDSVVETYLRRVEGLRRTRDFALYAVSLVRSYKRELDANLPTLRVLQAELRKRDVELTECRLLDLFLWGYSGTYTPIYLREDDSGQHSTPSAAAPALAARRPGVPAAAAGLAVEIFRDDDAGYLAWLARHPEGYVLNAARSPRPNNLVLHRASCRTINGVPTRGGPWTGPYIKICADDPLRIAAWAGATVGAAPRPCGSCHRRE